MKFKLDFKQKNSLMQSKPKFPSNSKNAFDHLFELLGGHPISLKLFS